MNRTRSFFVGLLPLLTTLLACGGGGGRGGEAKPPTMATRFEYANPPSTPSDWRIEIESGQGTNRLVLKLLGPNGLRTKGVSFFLTCQGSHAQWAQTDPGTALNLGPEPRLFRAKQGDFATELQVGLYQKAGLATLGQAPLALMTLELKPGSTPGPIPLSATAGKTSVYLHENGSVTSLSTIQIGTLSAR